MKYHSAREGGSSIFGRHRGPKVGTFENTGIPMNNEDAPLRGSLKSLKLNTTMRMMTKIFSAHFL